MKKSILSAYCFLSVHHIFSFLIPHMGKPKCFCTSVSKLTLASIFWQTLSLISPWPLAKSATIAPLLDLYKQSAKDNRHAWANGKYSSHLPASPLLQLKKMLFARKTVIWNHYASTTISGDFAKIEDTAMSLPMNRGDTSYSTFTRSCPKSLGFEHNRKTSHI